MVKMEGAQKRLNTNISFEYATGQSHCIVAALCVSKELVRSNRASRGQLG